MILYISVLSISARLLAKVFAWQSIAFVNTTIIIIMMMMLVLLLTSSFTFNFKRCSTYTGGLHKHLFYILLQILQYFDLWSCA